MKTWMLAFCIFWIASSSFANNPFIVVNNTNAYGTAQTGFSPCSSNAGDTGIVKPHSSFKVIDSILDYFCKKSCNVKVYMNKNCSSKPIGTVKIDRKQGVMAVDNHHVNGFILSGTGFQITVDGGPATS